MIAIGIDPGKTGYIVRLDTAAHTATTLAIPFRPDEIVCYRTIKRFVDFGAADIIVLEKVSCQPKWSAFSGMTFGKITGQLQMLISPYAFREISSRRWQRDIHIGFADTMDAKAKSMAAFYRINPGYVSKKKVDHNLVDAFLIADYGLRINNQSGKGDWRFDHIQKGA